jgi:hypothetical protein
MGMEQMRDDPDTVKAVEALKRKAKEAKEDLADFQKGDDPEEVASIEDLKRR